MQAFLERYDYPGNVRELENAVEHAVAVSERSIITAADLPTHIRSPRLLPSHEPERTAGAGALHYDLSPTDDMRATWSLADVEKEHIQRVLLRNGGNATTAAKQLGISRTTLWRKLRQYGLKRTGER